MVHLVVTPLIAAGVMVRLVTLRQKRGQNAVGMDKFVYACCFALSMAMLRNTYAA